MTHTQCLLSGLAHAPDQKSSGLASRNVVCAAADVVQGVLGEFPHFLRPWQRQVVLAGVQLRFLHALPDGSLATCLTESAAAEVARINAACSALGNP